jgi:CubicO group peptidase (beta-lactamase class C family)
MDGRESILAPMRLGPAAALLFALAARCIAGGAPRDVSALLQPIREKHDLPALAAAVTTSATLVAIGVDGVRERGKPEKASVDDKWHLGSCTKAMTATLCGMLVEDKKLSFDDTVAKTWPEMKVDAAWRDVTLSLFLHHRSGAVANMKEQGTAPRYGFTKSPSKDRKKLVETLLGVPPDHAPGTAFLYSNAGYMTAGAFAEKADGKSWEDLMRERLFGPLDMKSAGFGPPGVADKLDQPRGHSADGAPVQPGPFADNPAAIAPAGTVHASLADWAKFVAIHLDAGKARYGRLLKPETFAALHKPMGEEPAYAAGWIVLERPWAGGRALMHAGSNTMWYCVAWLAPARDFAVLVCCNQAGDAATQACDEAASALIRDHLAQAKK